MSWNNLSDRWKDYFIQILHTTACMSKDENTKVGSLIIDTDRKVVVSSSWNDLPRVPSFIWFRHAEDIS